MESLKKMLNDILFYVKSNPRAIKNVQRGSLYGKSSKEKSFIDVTINDVIPNKTICFTTNGISNSSCELINSNTLRIHSSDISSTSYYYYYCHWQVIELY